MRSTYDIIPACDIDYTDIDEICGYQMLMCKIYENEGGLIYPHLPNDTLRKVQYQGLVWLTKVREIIEKIVSGKSSKLTLAAIPQLLNSYDIYHRISKGEPDNSYIRSVRLKTAGLRAKGNKSITETYLVLELLKEISRDSKTLDRKYSTYALSITADWIKELMRHGTFHNIPKAETYARLQYLIRDDLFAYLDSETEAQQKSRWISTHTLQDDQLDTLDTETLLAYNGFAQSALIHTRRFDEMENLHIHILTKLATRQDLNRHLRQTIHLTLSRLEPA